MRSVSILSRSVAGSRTRGDITKANTYVDRPETRTVAGSHVLVERLDGVRTAELTELLVHVVRARARVVADPDTEVLDLERLLLVNLAEQRKKQQRQRQRLRSAIRQLPIPPAT